MSGGGLRAVVIADTHVPRRARDLPAEVWGAVDGADLVVHAGDWVDVATLDRLEARGPKLLACWGNNDGPELRARLPEVARASVEGVGRPDEAAAMVVIDDLGDEIRQEDRERIFEEGTRGLTAAKMGRIPGSGLGLWEARAVVEAHGGKISVTCEPTRIRRRQGLAYRVVFTVRIPLGLREAMEGR